METFVPIALCDTKDLSHDDWLKMRQGKLHNIPCTVGGSEVAAILDISPWTSSLELYDKKCGNNIAIKKEFNATNKQYGHIFERYVQELFRMWFKRYYHIDLPICESIEEFNQVENGIFNDTRFYQHGNPKYSFAVANVDGLIKIKGRIGILEYKTTSPKGNVGKKTIRQWRNGIPPIYYACQCQHYMGVLQVSYTFLCCAWGFSLDDFSAIYMDRNLCEEEALFEAEKNFVHTVIAGKPWDATSCDTTLLHQYYTIKYGEAKPDAPPVILNADYYPYLEKMVERSEYRKKLKEELQKLDDEDDRLVSILYPVIKDGSFCICQGNGKTIYLEINTPKQRFMTHEIENNCLCEKAGFDYQAFSQEHPELVKDYTLSVFDVKRFKEMNKALFNRYKKDPLPTGEKSSFTAFYRED